MYHGVATLSDGTVIEVSGTIQECACWADNLIREHNGEITIRVKETQEPNT